MSPVIAMSASGAYVLLVLGAHLLSVVPLLSLFNSQGELRARCGEAWSVVALVLLLAGATMVVVGALGGGGQFFLAPAKLVAESGSYSGSGVTQFTPAPTCSRSDYECGSISAETCVLACEALAACDPDLCSEYSSEYFEETGENCPLGC